MNKIKKNEALFFLNQMEVIDSDGGEECYAIVENNEENRELLKSAGIPLEVALNYSSLEDGKDFCIVSLASDLGIANYWTGQHLMYLNELDELDRLTEETKHYHEFVNEVKIALGQPLSDKELIEHLHDRLRVFEENR